MMAKVMEAAAYVPVGKPQDFFVAGNEHVFLPAWEQTALQDGINLPF